MDDVAFGGEVVFDFDRAVQEEFLFGEVRAGVVDGFPVRLGRWLGCWGDGLDCGLC